MFGRAIEPRERRTLVLAALVSALAIVTAYAVLPFARRWTAREDAIAAKREQLARLRWLVRNETRLTRMADEKERALDAAPRRLLVGESASLASAELQRVVLEHAESSRLQVQQVDVAAATADAEAQLGTEGRTVGARLSAVGDVAGLADFLERLTRGSTYARMHELDVQPNAARGDLLTIGVSVRAPFVQP
ncbi:MAG TPA: hypothetical protein VJ717_17520 [Gemmatimonadaceae bacterium]|nr:hypothetical protein [Gemmatimonadaceae bacterium]